MAMDISGLNKAVLNTQRKLEQLTENVEKIKSQIYPIGSVYISLSDKDPKTLFGGEWEKLEGRFLLSSSEIYTIGETAGESRVTLDEKEMPIHTHDRGTMNITGSWEFMDDSSNAGVDAHISGTGAFSGIEKFGYGSSVSSTSGEWYLGGGVKFDASDSWTGETGESGGNNSHNNMPPYLVVNMWKRTA